MDPAMIRVEELIVNYNVLGLEFEQPVDPTFGGQKGYICSACQYEYNMYIQLP